MLGKFEILLHRNLYDVNLVMQKLLNHMKIIFCSLCLTIMLCACSKKKEAHIPYPEAMCLEAGYPKIICDCIKSKLSKFDNVVDITPIDIEKTLQECSTNTGTP